MTLKKRYVGLLGWLAVTFAAALIGTLASLNAPEFYAVLVKPDWAPATWLFGPVWAVLYVLMAVAAWLAWRARGFGGARMGLSLFLVQLAFNALWAWLFFGWHLGALAFADALLLWFLVAATLFHFWRANVLAGALLVPYLAWVTYALALNYSVWQHNPQML